MIRIWYRKRTSNLNFLCWLSWLSLKKLEEHTPKHTTTCFFVQSYIRIQHNYSWIKLKSKFIRRVLCPFKYWDFIWYSVDNNHCIYFTFVYSEIKSWKTKKVLPIYINYVKENTANHCIPLWDFGISLLSKYIVIM